ncbi:MAG: exopolysaccharide biosynthesis polyprenyl glycosylphosphotransferase [Candidatus Caenarcaniphilales bacterium]|nr:exopolysaccharide biosynthesis polyprenyl glycosylphosphotransferase [Candidatus Caenarcaniphilales bacterium]
MFSSFVNEVLIRSKRLLLIGLDYFFLLMSIFIAHIYFEYPEFGLIPDESSSLWISFLVFIFLVQFVVFYTSELYIVPTRHKRVLKTNSIYLLLCLLIVFSLIAIFCYATKFSLGRDVLLLGAFISFICSVVNRLLLVQVFSPKYFGLTQPIKCLFVGNGPLSEQLKIERNFVTRYKLIEFNILENASCFREIIKELGVEVILIDPTSNIKISNELLEELIKLKFQQIQVVDMGSFFEKVTFKVPLLYLTGSWFLNTQVFNEISNRTLFRAKRIFDIFVVLLLAPVALPLVLISGALMKLTSSGKIIYKQERVGENGQIFTVFKLRSMIEESEKDGVQWTLKNDPRITRIGKFLRTLRIDELPQLWNIFIGEMSLIGPRPERPEFTKELKRDIPYYDLRHSVKPGLSGWAQINEPLASPSESLEKLEYDLFYVRNISLWIELSIVLQTIKVIFMRKGR